jgi:hypothetical protein
LSYDKHIVGVADCGGLQFYWLFSDSSRSACKQYPHDVYKQHKIPEGSHIHKVSIQYHKVEGTVRGFEFQDKEGKVLMVTDNHKNKGLHGYYEFELGDDERMCGLKSGFKCLPSAMHWQVQFIILKN